MSSLPVFMLMVYRMLVNASDNGTAFNDSGWVWLLIRITQVKPLPIGCRLTVGLRLRLPLHMLTRLSAL